MVRTNPVSERLPRQKREMRDGRVRINRRNYCQCQKLANYQRQNYREERSELRHRASDSSFCKYPKKYLNFKNNVHNKRVRLAGRSSTGSCRNVVQDKPPGRKSV